MWKTIEHDFGSIRAGSKLEYVFENDGSKVIKDIKGSCPCISIYPNGKTLRVVWKTRDDIKESFESFKYVYITYRNSEMEILTLMATLNP